MKVYLFISLVPEETKLNLFCCRDMSTISSPLSNFQTCCLVLNRFARLLKASKTLHFHSFSYSSLSSDFIIFQRIHVKNQVMLLSVFKASGELCFMADFQLHNAQGQVKSSLLCQRLSPKEIIWHLILLIKKPQLAYSSFSQN